MSGIDSVEEHPQIVSIREPSSSGRYEVSFRKIIEIPIPGVEPKSREELGYPSVDRWTRSGQATGAKFGYLVSLFFMMWPLAGLPFSLSEEVHLFLFSGFLIGFFVLFSQLNTSRKLRKYGPALLKLGTVPEVGGTASGVIRFPKALRGCDLVEIKLACYEKDAIRTGDNSYRDAECWSVKQKIRTRNDGKETIVSFSFEVPPGLPVNELLVFYWNLELQGSGRCKSLLRTWKMPVDTVAETA